MARSLLYGPTQILPGSITRALLNTGTAGSAVITRVIAGTNVTLSSTGADPGTGDVTVNASASGGSGISSGLEVALRCGITFS